jgi:starch synthase
MKIVIVSSEIAPFSKTGGLADVAGALGPALVRRGHQVITVSPRHGMVDPLAHGAVDTGLSVGVHAGGWMHPVRYWRATKDGVHHLLVDHSMFHRSGVYGDASGTYTDNHIRFAVLCRAAVEAARRVPLPVEGGPDAPLGEDAIFHVHDWPCALLPVFLEALYRPLGVMPWAPTVLTIHNVAHQGRLPSELFRDLDLSARWFSTEGLEWYGDLGLLKGGLLQADQITTVSPTYARDITTPEHGFGLDALLRHRSYELHGILNGIDANVWNPATDPHLAANYSIDDMSGKAKCKEALQADMGLPQNAAAPLIGTVGRLDPQKGVELLIDVIPTLVREQGAQFVIVGTAAAAHQQYEQRLRELQYQFPRNVCAFIGFSERLAHRVEAGADLFAMPSLFEPCGLNQMYSMRYGTVPVVRWTGGLADSVEPIDVARDVGTGFSFQWYDARALADTLRHAVWVRRERPEVFANAQKRGMAHDWSWDAVVPKYEQVYRWAAQRKGLVLNEPEGSVPEVPALERSEKPPPKKRRR